jgi:hypothetical protein
MNPSCSRPAGCAGLASGARLPSRRCLTANSQAEGSKWALTLKNIINKSNPPQIIKPSFDLKSYQAFVFSIFLRHSQRFSL